MNIAIDISQVGYEGTGVARYTKYLIDALLNNPSCHEYFFFYSSLRQPLDTKIRQNIKSTFTLKEYRLPPTVLNYMWNTVHKMPIEKFVGDIDVYISSDWAQAPTRTAKKITIVHDLVCYTHPKTLTYKTTYNVRKRAITPNIVSTQKKRLSWVVKECDRIIADSYNTKEDILTYTDYKDERIDVVYPYIPLKKPTKAEVDHTLGSFHLKIPFILSVGKLEPRKNIKRLIDAFLEAHITSVDLVIVGQEGWDNTRYSHHKNIKFLRYVSDKDLCALYSSAQFFVYPSLYEGFGYPLIEAMSMGCPVATSNTSSLKEIAEGYGRLFDPYDTHSIAAVLKDLSSHSTLLKDLSKRSIVRSHDFSEKKYFTQIMNVIDSLV